MHKFQKIGKEQFLFQCIRQEATNFVCTYLIWFSFPSATNSDLWLVVQVIGYPYCNSDKQATAVAHITVFEGEQKPAWHMRPICRALNSGRTQSFHCTLCNWLKLLCITMAEDNYIPLSLGGSGYFLICSLLTSKHMQSLVPPCPLHRGRGSILGLVRPWKLFRLLRLQFF